MHDQKRLQILQIVLRIDVRQSRQQHHIQPKAVTAPVSSGVQDRKQRVPLVVISQSFPRVLYDRKGFRHIIISLAGMSGKKGFNPVISCQHILYLLLGLSQPAKEICHRIIRNLPRPKRVFVVIGICRGFSQ